MRTGPARVAAVSVAQAQVTTEPQRGGLAPGQVVLVDDGTCGPGRIKKVTGGSEIDPVTGERRKGSPRQRACVGK